ncbi:hypothetical protein BJD99_00785 [Rhodococcus sp. 1163]|uniref:DNA/RNA non-specific endonuclease n=1 Tax=Rhodococcus sp. 1163 TaxID=1905289 RepID=UPI000A09F24F|nr:DNA/RNA non-specific endonuclease [Rhodococcus sp. 1163]ORI19856.1 hypothetical protein BJD99_00785 [Rhodococcus sp. 1163]
MNIGGSQLRDVERGDDWRLDPRLPATQQAGPQLYASSDLYLGHLVRRRDPVWGTAAVAELANDDTFHYTVCGPQTATLNQMHLRRRRSGTGASQFHDGSSK